MVEGLRIIVLGYIVRGPIGGMAWHHLQYVMGLAQLGHEVYFVEDSNDYPSCYDPTRHVTDTDPAYGLKFAKKTFDRAGHNGWAYYDAYNQRWHGPCRDKIVEKCETADLLLDLSGVSRLRPWVMKIPVRVLIDTDPVFTQLRHLTSPSARCDALKHTAFFSFGENIGSDSSSCPDDHLPWQPTRQPIVLDAWHVTPAPEHGKFTTVMQWESYPPLEYNGKRYGMKSDSFGPYLDLPEKTGSIFELALGSADAPRDLLRSKGWLLRNPLEVTRDIFTYQRYIQESRAEFSVAKHGYVTSWSGWFSERSAAYLASGRPVLVQDTGFTEWLETGYGVIPFSNIKEALYGIEEINSRYEFHCRAARAIAKEYFDARKVLSQLIEGAIS